MMLVTEGVVLSRRKLREYDRMAFLYTRSLGKVGARFIGVDRPHAKLKALSEPMVYGEYRLYVRLDGRIATVTGGRLMDSHPRARGDLSSTLLGLEICELLLRLTPESAPNAAKFDLIVDHLRALDESPSPWLALSFGLRLMNLAGFGPTEPVLSAEDRKLWLRLQEAPPQELAAVHEDPLRLSRFRHALESAVEYELGGMLNTRAFRESMAKSRETMAAV